MDKFEVGKTYYYKSIITRDHMLFKVLVINEEEVQIKKIRGFYGQGIGNRFGISSVIALGSKEMTEDWYKILYE